MEAASRQRGPDGSGFWQTNLAFGHLHLAHNLLKIADCTHDTKQPFVSEDGRFALAYNGEIYNHLALRKLCDEVSWQTHSDTETLFHLLIKYGIRVVKKLHGMFAFAFVDVKQNHIWLTRDPSGIKPLFYYEDEQYFIAASDIRAIKASGLARLDLDEASVTNYLSYRHTRPNHSFYKNIKAILPGVVVRLSATGRTEEPLNVTPVFRQTDIPPTAGYVQKTLGSALQQVVSNQLQADVPTGLMLSGGIDSTLLLALAHQPELPCFTVVAPNTKAFATEDVFYADKAAKQYGGRLHYVDFGWSEADKAFSDYINQTELPVADPAVLLTAAVARQARKQGIKVLLSGAGADEWFAGYNRHKGYYQYLLYLKKLPWNFLKKTKPMLPAGREHPLRKQFRLANQLMEKAEKDPLQTFINFTAMPGVSDALFIKSFDRQPAVASLSTEDCLQFAFVRDIEHYLANDVLAITDWAGMQHGVEIRVPYLDEEVIALMRNVSAEKRLTPSGKWPLKYLLDLRGGELYTKRTKEGFGVPMAAWLRLQASQKWLSEVANPSNPLYQIINYQEAQKLMAAHLSCSADYSAILYALALMSKWLAR